MSAAEVTVPRRAVAALLAVGFATAVGTGRAGLFVRPWFTGVLIGTSVLLTLVAVRIRGTMPAATAALLALPLAVGVTLTPALVGTAGQGSTSATAIARLGDPANPLLAGRGGDVTILQVLLAEQQLGGVALSGRQVSLVAVVAGPHTLRRAAIVCCAADAQTVTLSQSGTPLPATGTWVRATGHLQAQGNRLVLATTTVTPTTTPSEPFL